MHLGKEGSGPALGLRGDVKAEIFKHNGLGAHKFKPEGNEVALEPWKPEPPLKNTLDPGCGTHTWRINALAGGWDTGCPGRAGTEMTTQEASREPSHHLKLNQAVPRWWGTMCQSYHTEMMTSFFRN